MRHLNSGGRSALAAGMRSHEIAVCQRPPAACALRWVWGTPRQHQLARCSCAKPGVMNGTSSSRSSVKPPAPPPRDAFCDAVSRRPSAGFASPAARDMNSTSLTRTLNCVFPSYSDTENSPCVTTLTPLSKCCCRVRARLPHTEQRNQLVEALSPQPCLLPTLKDRTSSPP